MRSDLRFEHGVDEDIRIFRGDMLRLSLKWQQVIFVQFQLVERISLYHILSYKLQYSGAFT